MNFLKIPINYPNLIVSQEHMAYWSIYKELLYCVPKYFGKL